MSSPRKILPPEILLESYRRNGGNKRATARELGVDKDTVRKNLALYGADSKPLTGGTVKPLKHNVLPLPEKGKVFRYLLTSAQNNTKVFAPFLKNLEAYAAWFETPARIMVSRFTYNKNAFANPRQEKPGKQANGPVDSDVWFDPALDAYVCDDPEQHGTCRWQLADGLWFCSEMQINPTAARPLSGLGTYTGTASSIFPHVKVAMEAVPTLPGNDTKHIYTTGTVTGRNYIQRKEGLKAEFHHSFSALMVEVNSDGDFWVRQIGAGKKGDFYDIPGGQGVHVIDGQVTANGEVVEALNWGDIHCEELPEERKVRYWGNGGVIDQLKPRKQFCHDLQTFRARNHHELKSFSKMYQRYTAGEDSVSEELSATADLLSFMERQFCSTTVIPSNHDRFGERWLDEANYKHDLPNVEFFLEAQLERVRAIKRGDDWMFLEWALKRAGCPETVRFLKLDESLVICEKAGHPIECGLHADLGPNGSRGSVGNLTNLGMKANFGHTHTACIRDGNVWAGVCSLKHDYNVGPTTWSVTHTVTYLNGKRAQLTEKSGKLWA